MAVYCYSPLRVKTLMSVSVFAMSSSILKSLLCFMESRNIFNFLITLPLARPISNALKAPVPTKASQAVSCRHLVLRA